MIKIIEADITLTDKDIIVQQVNCRGFMGAGLAKTIMQRYPNVRKEYRSFREKQLKTLKDDEKLLGLVNYIDVYDGKIIANVFGQVDIRQDRNDKTVYTKKEALFQGIEDIKNKAKKLNFSVAIPTYIGCGLAGGDWEEIQKGIEAIFENSSVDVVFYHYRK
ncbi:Appr-1-p processing protein [Bacillus sp. M6-12]|uniref:macro domain-containing protein n=1 Tax=Bacillus sp. M6-12 TaxID=2054166 RepID=UPI000C793F28|nr:macro domain-containing protein [Bacillus sp. M6-12]PLS19516.1 Appr-1-p processing protein [Bacillus sp. M6-12]